MGWYYREGVYLFIQAVDAGETPQLVVPMNTFEYSSIRSQNCSTCTPQLEGGGEYRVGGRRGGSKRKGTHLKSWNATNGKIHIKSIILTRGKRRGGGRHMPAPQPQTANAHPLHHAPGPRISCRQRCQEGEANTVQAKNIRISNERKDMEIMKITLPKSGEGEREMKRERERGMGRQSETNHKFESY